MCPILGKWKMEDKAMFAAEDEIEDSDILGLIERVTNGDLASVKEVYVDLSKVRMFSPFAVALLYSRYPQIVDRGKRLLFLNPNEVSLYLLRLFGADYIFPVVKGI
ncbi:MAG: hypothetical protein Kow00107_01190 [Planctomycetota bacterium]